jgi:phosphoribosyl 1,2-cyclic phosphodiesterase
LNPADLDAICVSHEHADHIQGVGVLSRRFDLPVYVSVQTAAAAAPLMGNIATLETFECGSPFSIKTLTFHPFALSHDAEDPAGFTISRNGTKIGIATDLGIATHMVQEHLRDCTALVLEANHDLEMLTNGPYPWPLKQRIKSRVGHLSNCASKDLLTALQSDRLEHVILAHLSETNNTAEKALNEVGRALTCCRPRLWVAFQDRCGELLFIK